MIDDLEIEPREALHMAAVAAIILSSLCIALIAFVSLWISKRLGWLLCLIGEHEWTCAAVEGIQPTAAQLAGGVAGFKNYAQMYCGRCRKQYKSVV